MNGPKQTASMVLPSPQSSHPTPGSHSTQQGKRPSLESQQYSYSPETVTSDLLSTDAATSRWLDLLATDAAQADSAFSLSQSPASEAVESYNRPSAADDPAARSFRSDRSSTRAESNRVYQLPAMTTVTDYDAAAEKHSWQVDQAREQDIVLESHEAVLFRNFAERASLWLDLFDPYKHFSTYATRLAVSHPLYFCPALKAIGA